MAPSPWMALMCGRPSGIYHSHLSLSFSAKCLVICVLQIRALELVDPLTTSLHLLTNVSHFLLTPPASAPILLSLNVRLCLKKGKWWCSHLGNFFSNWKNDLEMLQDSNWGQPHSRHLSYLLYYLSSYSK